MVGGNVTVVEELKNKVLADGDYFYGAIIDEYLW